MGCAHGRIATRSNGETAAGSESPRDQTIRRLPLRPYGGCAPGPAAHSGAAPVPLGSVPSGALATKGNARLPGLAFVPPRRLRPSAGLFAHGAFCRAGAPTPALARAGAPRPLRAHPARFPPLPRSASCALTRSVGARCRRRLGPRPCCAAASLRVGLAPRGLGPCAARRPAGGSACPLRAACALRSRPGPRAAVGPLFPLRGPGLGCLRAAACGRLLRLSGGTAVVGGVLPCRPPPCRPRWGLPGARGPFGWALPPAAWVALLAPLLRSPPGRDRAPGGPLRARLTIRKLSTGP